MRIKGLAILFAILALAGSPLGAEEIYQCVPEQAAGFIFDPSSSRWKSVNLVAENAKYIIRGAISPEGALSIMSAGTNYEECRSSEGYGNTNQAYFECFFGEFIFNKNTGRFIRTYTAGYTDGLDNDKNTPAILIGSCSPL